MREFVCPGCRRKSLDARLFCETCRRRFVSLAVDHGPRVALLLDEDESEHATTVTERILEALDRGSQFADALDPADMPFVQALALYGGAHWGAFATPALPVPDLSWIGAMTRDAAPGPALVLGAATCGEVLQIAPERDVVALDGSAPMLGFVSGLSVADQWLPCATTPGRYTARRVSIPDQIRERLARLSLVAADARQPPLPPSSFALILCLNLVDSITHPRELLLNCEALLAPGGLLLVASPYNWDDDVTPPERRLDPHGVREVLAGSRRVHAQDDIPWPVRVHDRLTAHYRLHAMVLQKR